MPYRYYLPNGQSLLVDDSTQYAEATEMAKQQYPDLFKQPEPEAEKQSWFGDVVSDPIKESLYNTYGNTKITAQFLSRFNDATPEERANPEFLNDLRKEIEENRKTSMEINPQRHSLRQAYGKFQEEGIGAGLGEMWDTAVESAAQSAAHTAIPLIGGAGVSAVGSPVAGGVTSASLMALQFLGQDITEFLDNPDNSLDDWDSGKAAVTLAGQTASEMGMLAVTGVLGGVLGGVGKNAAKSAALNAVGKTVNKLREAPAGIRVLGAMGGEGSAEVFQDALARWNAGLPMAPRDVDEMWNYAESFYGGFAGGGLFEAVGSGIEYVGRRRETQAEIESINIAQERARKQQEEQAQARLEKEKQLLVEEQNAIEKDMARGRTKAEYIRIKPKDIHALADERNINWDNDAGFMAFTERITRPNKKNRAGKLHLDQLNQEELNKVYGVLQEMPVHEQPTSFNLLAEQSYYNIYKKLRDQQKNKKEGPKAVSRDAIKKLIGIDTAIFDDKHSNAIADQAIRGMKDRGLIKTHGIRNVLEEDASTGDKHIYNALDKTKELGVFPTFAQWKNDTGLRSMKEYQRIKKFLLNSGQIIKDPDAPSKLIPTNKQEPDVAYGYNYDVGEVSGFTVRDESGNIKNVFKTKKQAQDYIKQAARDSRISHMFIDQNGLINEHRNRGLAIAAAKRKGIPVESVVPNTAGLTISDKRERVARIKEKRLRQDRTVNKIKDIGYFNTIQEAEQSRDELARRRQGHEAVGGSPVSASDEDLNLLRAARASEDPATFLGLKGIEKRRALAATKADPRKELLDDVKGALRAELKELGLEKRGIGVELALDPKEVANSRGWFGSNDHVIRVAVDHIKPTDTFEEALASVYGVFSHETIHASRRLGLITKKEWESLVNETKKRQLKQKSTGSTKSMYDIVKQAYQQDPNVDTSGWIEDDFAEEAVADLFKVYAKERLLKKVGRDKTVQGAPSGIFKRLINALRSIGKAFRSQGLESADVVLDRIYRGELADRQVGRDIWFGKRPQEKKELMEDFIRANSGRRAIGYTGIFKDLHEEANNPEDYGIKPQDESVSVRYSIADGIAGAETISPSQKNKDGTYRILTGMEIPTDKEGHIQYMQPKWVDARVINPEDFLDLDKEMGKQGPKTKYLAMLVGLMNPTSAGFAQNVRNDVSEFIDRYEQYLLELQLNLMSASNSLHMLRDRDNIPRVRSLINIVGRHVQGKIDQLPEAKSEFEKADTDIIKISTAMDFIRREEIFPHVDNALYQLRRFEGMDEYADSILDENNKFFDETDDTVDMYEMAAQYRKDLGGASDVLTLSDTGLTLMQRLSEMVSGLEGTEDRIKDMLVRFGIPGYQSAKSKIKAGKGGLLKVERQSINNTEPTLWVFDHNALAIERESNPIPELKGRASIRIPGIDEDIAIGSENLYKPVAEINEDIKAVSPYTTYDDAMKALGKDAPAIDLGGGQLAIIQNENGFKNPIAYFVMSDDTGKRIHRVETSNNFGAASQYYKHPMVPQLWGPEVSTRAVEILFDNNASNIINRPQPTTNRLSIDFNPEFEATKDDADWLARMTPTARKKNGLYDRLVAPLSEGWVDRFRQAFVDKYQAIARNERIANALRKERGEYFSTLASQGAHAKALLADRSAAVLASAFKYGSLKFDKLEGGAKIDDFKLNGKYYNKANGGLVDIFAPLITEHGRKNNLLQKWHVYAIGLRGQRLNAEGKLIRMEEADIKRALRLGEMHPEIKEVHDNYQRWNEYVVDFMKDTGVINDKMAQVWKKYSDYVPFYKNLTGETTDGIIEIMRQELNSQEIGIINSLVNRQPSKRLTGSENEIMDPLEAITRNVHAAIASGLRNYAATRALQDAVLIGQAEKIVKAIDPSTGKEARSQEEYNKKMSSAGAVNIRVNGEKEWYLVNDPLLFEAIAGFNNGHHPFLDLMAKPANFLRETVTRTPEFMVANLMRDSLSVWATSGANLGAAPVAIAKGMQKAAGNLMGKDIATLERLERVGGSVGGYDLGGVDISTKGLEALLRQQDRTYRTANPAKLIRKLWDDAGRVSSIVESSTRQRVYETVLRETGNEIEAAFQAMEVLNFSRRGNNAIYRAVTMMIPFLNARVQGLDVLARAYTGSYGARPMSAAERKKAFIIRMGSLVGMGLMYAMLMGDDEWYQEATREHRDNNFIVPSPPFMGHDSYFMLPIAFEVGIITKLIPEVLYRYLTDQTTGRDARKSITTALASTMHFDFLPQAIKPIAEAVMNYDTFKGGPILDRYMSPGEDAYRPSTNEVAKMLGSLTGISPLKIEHVMRGYTGSVGTYALSISDAAARWIFDRPRQPAYEFGDARHLLKYPFFRRFLLQEMDGGSRQQFYDLKYHSDALTATISNLKEAGKFDEIKEIRKDNKAILSIKRQLDAKGRIMQTLNKRKRKIEMAGPDKYTPEQKAKLIDKIERRQMKLLENIRELEQKAQLPLFGMRH